MQKMRHLRLLGALGLVALVVPGCRTRLIDGTPGVAPVDIGVVDGGNGDGPLMSNPDAAMCASDYFLAPIPIERIDPDDLNIKPGTLGRVDISYTRSSCEPPGPVLVVPSAGNTAFTVTVQVWRTTECFGTLVHEKRTLILSELLTLPQGTLVVRDGAPGSSAANSFTVQALDPKQTCTNNGPPGTCELDCHCTVADVNTRCQLDTHSCVRICHADSECPSDAPHCSSGLCRSLQALCSTVICPYGERCSTAFNGASCQPAQTATPGDACITGCGVDALCTRCGCLLPCAVDGECPAGRKCTADRGCQ